MVKVATLAAALGAVAGLWASAGSYFGLVVPICETGLASCPSSAFSLILYVEVIGIAVLLISLATLVGPRSLFYVEAAASAGLFLLVYLEAGFGVGGAVTEVLSAGGVLLSVLSAWRKPTLSEQSNPMNLPVFG